MNKVLAIAAFVAAALVLSGAEQSPPGKALGNPTAPIRIDLFSDYQCPGCKMFNEQTLQPLINNYVKAGKVYLVHREFPLPIHPHAREAATYACAAEKVGKYEQVGDQLFKMQDSWSKDGDVAGAACSILTPEEAKKVRALASTPQVASEVDEDIRAGRAEKVAGTPTMIITKLIRRFPVTGPVTYAVLSRFLDSLLD